MVMLALIQAALPTLASLWLMLGKPATLADLIFRVIAAWLLLAGVGYAGIWLALPIITVPLLSVLVLLATIVAAIRYRKRGAQEATRVPLWTGRLVTAGLLLLGSWLVIPALAGRVEPDTVVDLSFPLRGGRYLVVNGGASERVNGHFMTLGSRFAAWRGESFAVDLIQVDDMGFRTRQRRLLALPPDPAAYLTFGAEVIAPCSGLVEAAEENHPDMKVPVRDRSNLAGNFVRLRCGELVVLLAHFQRDGVAVQPGERVAVGDFLGRVGNSGNSDEPHLHVHAQRPGPPESPLSGDPLFIRLDGRFLARNMIVDPGNALPLRR